MRNPKQQMEIEMLREQLRALRRTADDTETLLDRYVLSQDALYQSEERFRLLVAEVKDYAIFMLDVDGNILSWNAGAQHIKGYRPDEIIGKHFSTFYRPEDIQSGNPQRALHIAADDGKYQDEGWRVRKDGTLFWASVLITALHDDIGTLKGFGKVTRDLTAQKQAEEEREQLHKRELELERQREAQRQTDLALQAHEQFLSTAAHELRTPMTSLTAYAQLLQRRLHAGEMNVARLLSPVVAIIEQAERLNRLTTTLLDQDRLGNGMPLLERHVVDLGAALPQIIESFKPIAVHRALNLAVPPDSVLIEGDAIRLEQILHNLLHNAVKYDPDGNDIAIVLRRDDHSAVISVTDHGIGIPHDEIPYLFDRFYRATNVRAADITGWGISLTIVKELVAAHHGTIEVESTLGHGTTVVLRLPLHYMR